MYIFEFQQENTRSIIPRCCMRLLLMLLQGIHAPAYDGTAQTTYSELRMEQPAQKMNRKKNTEILFCLLKVFASL